MRLSRGAKAVLAGATGLILCFIYAPLLLVTWFVVKGQFPDTKAKPAQG